MSHNIPDPASLSVENVIETSAANVEGYLRNASRKNRHVAAGEGGRGTKVNRGGAVTSAAHNTLEAFKKAAADAAPDGTFRIKRDTESGAAETGQGVKREAETNNNSSSKNAAAADDDDDDVRVLAGAPGPTDANAAAADDDDDDEFAEEDWDAVELGDEGDAVKAVKAEAAAAAASGDVKPVDGEFDGVDERGERTHTDTDIGAAAGADGRPATLWELREEAKAKRWVEKNHLFAQCVTAFVLFVGQARRLYRSARDPHLAAALGAIPSVAAALREASATLADPLAAEIRKRNDMSPAWVSVGKDGTGTSTGAAARIVAACVNALLEFVPPPPPPRDDDPVDAREDAAVAAEAAVDSDDDDAAMAAAQQAAAASSVGDGRRLGHETGPVPVAKLLLEACVQAAAASTGGGDIKVEEGTAAAREAASAAATTRKKPAPKRKKPAAKMASTAPRAAAVDLVEVSDSDDGATAAPATAASAPVPQPQRRQAVPHPVHFTVAFVAAASSIGLRCRLCTAFGTYDVVPRETKLNGADDAFRVTNADRAAQYRGGDGGSSRTSAAKKKSKKGGPAATDADNASKKPQSPFWAEVWCPIKRMWFSVNPCSAVTTRWGAAYTVACGGDHVADVTPRYISAWSAIFRLRIDEMHYTKGFLWPAELLPGGEEHGKEGLDEEEGGGDEGGGGDVKTMASFACAASASSSSSAAAKGAAVVPVAKLTPTQRVLWPLRQDVATVTVEMLEREEQQLVALTYSEPVPASVTELKGHPLFVTEDNVTRYEGIYPKTGRAVVGYVRGKPVYRRDCVHPLRSKQGWLRIGRMVSPDDEPPYKLAPPPPTRPLVAYSQFYGRWQTVPFKPAPITSDGKVPRYEPTTWYLLLLSSSGGGGGGDNDAAVAATTPVPGEGLTHLTEPNVAAAARRMQAEFAVAVTGWVKERAGQERPLGGGANNNGFGRRGRDAPPAQQEGEETLEGAPNFDTKGNLRAPTSAYSRVHYSRQRWVAQFNGIVVPTAIADSVRQAYREWAAIRERAEAAKRKQRATRWWRVFIQLALARLRIASDYAQGSGEEQGRNGRGRRPAIARARKEDIA